MMRPADNPFDPFGAALNPAEPPDHYPLEPPGLPPAFVDPTARMLDALEAGIERAELPPPQGFIPLPVADWRERMDHVVGDPTSQMLDDVEASIQGRTLPPGDPDSDTELPHPEESSMSADWRAHTVPLGKRPLPVSGDQVNLPLTAIEPAPAARLYCTRDGISPPSYHTMRGTGAKASSGNESSTIRLCPESHDFTTQDVCESLCDNFRDWSEDGSGDPQCYYDWEAEKAADSEHRRDEDEELEP